jgi:hypothetical protein
MSQQDSTTENTPAAPVESDAPDSTTDSKAYVKPVTNNAVVDGLIDLAISKAEAANNYAATVSSSKGTFAKSVKDYRENSEDADVAEYRKWEDAVYTELNKRRGDIDKAIASRLGGESISPEELDAAETQYKDAAKDAREAWKAALSTAVMFGVSLNGAEAPALTTLGGRESSVAGPKSGSGRRFWFDDVTVNGESHGSLSKAALFITQQSKVKTTASDLQATMIEDAKSDDYSKLNDHTFEYSVTKDGKTHRFDVTTFKAPEKVEAVTTDSNAEVAPEVAPSE